MFSVLWPFHFVSRLAERLAELRAESKLCCFQKHKLSCGLVVIAPEGKLSIMSQRLQFLDSLQNEYVRRFLARYLAGFVYEESFFFMKSQPLTKWIFIDEKYLDIDSAEFVIYLLRQAYLLRATRYGVFVNRFNSRRIVCRAEAYIWNKFGRDLVAEFTNR
jgi:hypothetical protein